jgi:hypothetical protein
MRTEHVYDGFMATASVETANVGIVFIIRERKGSVGRFED